MADISKIQALDGVAYDIKDTAARNSLANKANATEAIKNITRSGTTYTATRCDDTTFTFDQQDTWRPVQNILTSTSQTDCLSAAMGKILRSLAINAYRAVAYYVDGDYFDGTLLKDNYIYIHNHSYLADGLYRAVKGVQPGTAITNSDVVYIGYGEIHKYLGGLNDLRAQLVGNFTPTVVSTTSIATFNYQLDAMLDSMEDGEARYVQYAPGGRYAPFMAYNYTGILYRVNANNAWADLRRNGDVMSGWKAAGVWSWASLTEHVLITSLVTFETGESISGTNTRIYAQASSVHVQYQGASKTHTLGTLLFTLPEGYRPHGLLYVPFVKFGGTTTAYGILSVNTNGAVSVSNISSTTAGGRIYATFDFPIAGWVQNP